MSTDEASAGQRVVVSREFSTHPFCLPFMGRVGSLVQKGSDGGGGWHVIFQDLKQTQFFSTGGYGGLFHLEYLPQGGGGTSEFVTTTPSSQAAAPSPLHPPVAATARELGGTNLPTNPTLQELVPPRILPEITLEPSKGGGGEGQVEGGVGGGGVTAAGPLQDQEQAALYVVVAEMVERRLLNSQEESQVFQATSRRDPYMYPPPHMTYTYPPPHMTYMYPTGIPGNIATRSVPHVRL